MGTAKDHRAHLSWRTHAPTSAEDGFTLVELLVTMLVAGIMMGGILTLFVNLTRAVATEHVRIQNQDDARLALNQITRYVRMASSSMSNMTSITDSLATTDTTDIVFYADIDGDGQTEKNRYYLSGTALRMQTAEPNMAQSPPTYTSYQTDGIIIDGVRNGSTPIFRYYRYDQSTTSLVETTSPSTAAQRREIVAVDVTLIVNEVPELDRGNARLESRVQIRQRYDGGLQG